MLHGKRVLRFFTAVIVAVAPLALADDASAIKIPGTYSYTQTVTVTYEGQSESANDQGMCLVQRRKLDWSGTIVVLGVEVTAKVRFNKRLKERLPKQTIKGQGPLKFTVLSTGQKSSGTIKARVKCWKNADNVRISVSHRTVFDRGFFKGGLVKGKLIATKP
ncbi:MAG: hypothetical protein ACYTEI_02790 [Planctomycetota bacterium]|jgi:hypothetical protein